MLHAIGERGRVSVAMEKCHSEKPLRTNAAERERSIKVFGESGPSLRPLEDFSVDLLITYIFSYELILLVARFRSLATGG